jgi:hypothetical protein
MDSSKAALVVGPGYPAELIQELLRDGILPSFADLAVLLPPEGGGSYDQLFDQKNFSGVRFLPSPGRRFFSLPHLKWLRANLHSSQKHMVLISDSLDRDLTSAMVAFVALLLSGKSITHFRKAQATTHENKELVVDFTNQNLSGQWTSKEFNPKVLAREIITRVTIAPPGHPWKLYEILYFLMFASLVIKQNVTKNLFSFLFKSEKSNVRQKTKKAIFEGKYREMFQ